MTATLRRLATAFTVGLVVLAPFEAPLQAQSESDERVEGALFLLLPVGAKAVALGRAMTAQTGSASVWWNPAGLARVDSRAVTVYRGDHPLAGEATALSALFTHDELGTMGFSYQLLDVGSQDVTDIDGNTVGTLSGRNHLGVLSLATSVWNDLAVGLNFKIVQARFSCTGQCDDAGVTATTFALDAGLQWHRVAGLPLTVATMLAHAGSDLQVLNEEQADPLPTRIRGAVAYDVLDHVIEEEALSLVLAVELEDRWRDPGDPATYLGAEFAAGTSDLLYVRAGYVFGAEQQVDGAAVGVGLRYERFDLGLAKSLASSTFAAVSEPVHISFGFRF